MIKNISVLFILALLFLSQLAYSSSFNNYGVKFDYPETYKLTNESKDGYSEVSIQSDKGLIITQIFTNKLPKDVINVYVTTYKKGLESEKFVISNSGVLKSSLKVNDPTIKGGKRKVKAVVHTLVFTKDNVSNKSSIYFFNEGTKGYVIVFTQYGSNNINDAISTFVKSFTVNAN
ncbi:MAG: hypothetical protein OEV44_02440 [Spirochaetota bacterium]|nr:hypothetical protein [Spirochaetota bacterium]